MNASTLLTLEYLFLKEKIKSSRTSAVHAHMIIVRGTAEYNWHERAIVTEARIKAFFSTTLATRKKLISEEQAMERAVATETTTVAIAAIVAFVVTTNRVENAALEGEPAANAAVKNAAMENNEFDVLCHTIDIAPVKELRNLHTEELPLYDEETI